MNLKFVRVGGFRAFVCQGVRFNQPVLKRQLHKRCLLRELKLLKPLPSDYWPLPCRSSLQCLDRRNWNHAINGPALPTQELEARQVR